MLVELRGDLLDAVDGPDDEIGMRLDGVAGFHIRELVLGADVTGVEGVVGIACPVGSRLRVELGRRRIIKKK